MWRLLLSILGIAALALFAGWFADQPGTLALEWREWSLEAPLPLGLLLLASVVILLLLVWRLFRLIINLPGWWGRRRALRQRDAAFNAFTQGMIAVAAGEGEAAAKWSARATRLFDQARLFDQGRAGDLALPRMLAAYAAEVAGDKEAARNHYTAMIADADTEFLGLRGLLQDAVRENDMDRALEISERAVRLRPGSVYASRLRIDLLARKGDWMAADGAIRAARKARAMGDGEAQRRLALIALGDAQRLNQDGRVGEALDRAEAAYKALPDFAPAAARLALLYMAAGKTRAAGKTLTRAWRSNPHPLLAEAFLRLHGEEAPRARLKAADAFFELRPEHAESQLLIAQCAVQAGEFARARTALDALPKPPGRRAAMLLAALEDAQYGDQDGAARWRGAAAHAGEDHGWTCHECHETAPAWDVLCPTCGAFGSLDWVRQKAGTPEVTGQVRLTAGPK